MPRCYVVRAGLSKATVFGKEFRQLIGTNCRGWHLTRSGEQHARRGTHFAVFAGIPALRTSRELIETGIACPLDEMPRLLYCAAQASAPARARA